MPQTNRDLTDPNWWRTAVVYQVYPRSFADGNGDGIGDLAGLIDRVPYLARLGIDAVWLSPFYPSALADGGYDVDDYRDVDPRIGTLDAVRRARRRAARRGHPDRRRHRAEPLRVRAPLVPGGARRGARLAPSGPATSSATGSASTASCRRRTG